MRKANMKHHRSLSFISMIACALSLVSAPLSRAASFHLSVDTSPLVGNLAGPFYINFQLNDGAGGGSPNNTVTIQNIQFRGGSAVGTPLTTCPGGSSGNLSSSVSISDSELFNQFMQQFEPGTTLSFDV